MERPSDTPPDDELIRRAVDSPWDQGGSESFWELWRRYEPWIRQRVAAHGAMAPATCARDIFVDAVLDRVRDNLIRGLRLFGRRGSLAAFLNRVVQRAAIDEYRHQRRRGAGQSRFVAASDDEVLQDGDPGVIDPAYRAPSLFPSPERLLLLRDRREKLRFVLVLLAAESDTGLKQALALRLRYIDGRTLESIAAEMGVVEHTVWYWIRDGLQAAARLLHERFRISSGAGL